MAGSTRRRWQRIQNVAGKCSVGFVIVTRREDKRPQRRRRADPIDAEDEDREWMWRWQWQPHIKIKPSKRQ